jgi:hypothetical protein
MMIIISGELRERDAMVPHVLHVTSEKNKNLNDKNIKIVATKGVAILLFVKFAGTRSLKIINLDEMATSTAIVATSMTILATTKNDPLPGLTVSKSRYLSSMKEKTLGTVVGGSIVFRATTDMSVK